VEGRKRRFTPSALNSRGSTAQGASFPSTAASSSSLVLPSNKKPRRLIPALSNLAESLASEAPLRKSISKDGRHLLLLPGSDSGPSRLGEEEGEEEQETFHLRGKRNHTKRKSIRAKGPSGQGERQRGSSLQGELDRDDDDPKLCDQEIDSYICSAEEVELRRLLAGRVPGGAD